MKLNRLKSWLYERFLPAWCREELLEDNKRLLARVSELKAEGERLRAYIDGLETALRLGRRIKIYTGEVMSDGPVERADRQSDL